MGGMMRKVAVKTGVVKKADPQPAYKVTETATGKPASKDAADLGNKIMNKVTAGTPITDPAKSDAAAKDTLGSSKKKRRLRDGRRSLISGSAMGVSDKLG
jgi:hypothetical protein